MHPDSYMPIYFRDLCEAVKSWPKWMKWCYVEALFYYWGHEHCRGLDDDDDALRNICSCTPEEWEKAKPKIFDNNKCFCLDAEDGRWHQKRADEEWAKSVAKYIQRSDAGRKGMKARYGR